MGTHARDEAEGVHLPLDVPLATIDREMVAALLAIRIEPSMHEAPWSRFLKAACQTSNGGAHNWMPPAFSEAPTVLLAAVAAGACRPQSVYGRSFGHCFVAGRVRFLGLLGEFPGRSTIQTHELANSELSD
jgi:hypothetical protein